MGELAGQYWAVLGAAFLVAAFFGAVVHHTHFCTMGAISDVVNMQDWTRARMWAMAVGVGMIGFYAMAAGGVIDPRATIYSVTKVQWLSALVGGSLFGLGMVLASGCGSKTLVRIGSGNLKSLVVFVVMGVASFATLKGITAVLRVNTVDRVTFAMEPSGSLPVWVSAQLGWVGPFGSALAVLVGLVLIAWAMSSADFRQSRSSVWGGLGVGFSVVAAWWVSGALGWVAEHPETLETAYLASNSGRMESLSFTAPFAYTLDWLMFYSDASKLLTLGVALVFGVVAGSFLMAKATDTFAWEGFASVRDTGLHLTGAVLMGIGGVTGLGCTVGQGLSGMSTLSAVSLFAMVGIIGGAVAGFKFQLWLLMRDD